MASAGGSMGNVMQINSGSDGGLVSDYNLVYNGGKAINWGDGHPAAADAHSLTTDPKFTSPSTGDYTPAAGSPTIKAGANLFSDVPHDVVGAARPSSGNFDIGAYQAK